MHPQELLERGARRLLPFFEELGFRYAFLGTVQGSGGVAAQGEFRRGRCFVRLHVRRALGIVEYGFDDTPDPLPVHRDIVERLGVAQQAEFPGFGDDLLANFTRLLADLQRFVAPLLADDEKFGTVIPTPTPMRRGRLP